MSVFGVSRPIGWILLTVSVLPLHAWQQASVPGTPASVVVTVEPKRGKTVPSLDQQDVSVVQDKERRPISGLVPLRDSGMQLLLLIDDSAGTSFDTEISTLKQFVNGLPASAEVGVGYMRNGMTQMTSTFTTDHAAAANSIRIAQGPGGADVSPYDSLSDAVKKWPQSNVQRREVIMISSGIEGLGGGYAPENPYVNAGIEAAQKAGVVVYTIYNPSAEHFGHALWRTNWGQSFLSQLSDETGGESYISGFSAPVSFGPYLEEISRALQNQYLLTFQARLEKKSGLQTIKVRVIEKDASVAAPDKVYVKAGL